MCIRDRQQTAAAAQALHAGTIQQQLLTGEAGADQQGQEPEAVSYTHLDVYKRQSQKKKEVGLEEFSL